MARRQSKTSATGGNLDSMLDTLTNVVGILVIVLVTVQLSSEEAARRISEAVQKLQPEEIAQIEQQVQTTTAAADLMAQQLEQRATAKPRDLTWQLAELNAEAENLRKEAAAKIEQAVKLAEQKERDRVAAKQAQQQALAEQQRLEKELQAVADQRVALAVELDSTKPALPLPAKEVRLPDPRPAPKGAKEMRILCREDRLYIVDIAAIQEQAQKRAAYAIRRKNLDPDNDGWIADGATFAEEFNKTPLTAGDFNLTLETKSTWPLLVLDRKPRSGSTADLAVKANGELSRLLRRVKPSDYFIRFFVWPDAFEAYLVARQFTNERGFAAGWEPIDSADEHRIGLGKYPIGKKPPPQPPSDKPAPPQKPPNLLD